MTLDAQLIVLFRRFLVQLSSLHRNEAYCAGGSPVYGVEQGMVTSLNPLEPGMPPKSQVFQRQTSFAESPMHAN